MFKSEMERFLDFKDQEGWCRGRWRSAMIKLNGRVSCVAYFMCPGLVQGKKLWTIRLPAPITTMSLMDHKAKGFQAVLVALANSEVHLYKDKILINVTKTQ
eukprot:g14328.t1